MQNRELNRIWIVSLPWSLLIYILRATSRHPCEIPRASPRTSSGPLYSMSVGPPRSPKKMHSGCNFECIVVSSGQRDIFSSNGNVAKVYGHGELRSTRRLYGRQRLHCGSSWLYVIKSSCLINQRLFVLDIEPLEMEAGGVLYCGLGFRCSG
jgi:hypothetical protein